MNKQGVNGIGWTAVFGPGTGYTANPVGGCHHDCQWAMPATDENGQNLIATCYAGDVAEGLAQSAYPHGFKHHYWRPEVLKEFVRHKDRRGIFVDSMSDLFGQWVPADQIKQVLKAAEESPQHIYQSLTKNPKKLLSFINDFPECWWIGVSSPPDFMFGKPLDFHKRIAMMRNTLVILHAIKIARPKLKVWMSLEPLTIHAGQVLSEYSMATDFAPDWLVVGAASRGKVHYQPERRWVVGVHEYADAYSVPIFHKENLVWTPSRKEFPVIEDIK